MVPADWIPCTSPSALCGPMSRIISSSRTSLARRIVGAASALNSLATTTSIGSGSVPPLSASVCRIRRHSGTRSGSASDLPIFTPWASRKVLAMPPPTTSRSTLCARWLRMVSLVETFAPATIASNGRRGCSSALPSASISAASSGPAQATGA
jgi:hypothetical protein